MLTPVYPHCENVLWIMWKTLLITYNSRFYRVLNNAKSPTRKKGHGFTGFLACG